MGLAVEVEGDKEDEPADGEEWEDVGKGIREDMIGWVEG